MKASGAFRPASSGPHSASKKAAEKFRARGTPEESLEDRRMAEAQVATRLIKDQVTDAPARKRGLAVKRSFTRPGFHPFDEIEWELRTASIQNEKGQTIFEQQNVEVPKEWSMTATNIVASKYFHGKLNTP